MACKGKSPQLIGQRGKMNMTKTNFNRIGTPFTYGGKTFSGLSGRITSSFKETSKHLYVAFDYWSGKPFTSYDSGTWNYKKFYEAAGKENKETDFFEEIETGNIYVPGDKQLFQWKN